MSHWTKYHLLPGPSRLLRWQSLGAYEWSVSGYGGQLADLQAGSVGDCGEGSFLADAVVEAADVHIVPVAVLFVATDGNTYWKIVMMRADVAVVEYQFLHKFVLLYCNDVAGHFVDKVDVEQAADRYDVAGVDAGDYVSEDKEMHIQG